MGASKKDKSSAKTNAATRPPLRSGPMQQSQVFTFCFLKQIAKFFCQ